ncbi:MAG: type 1 glutamine amidotransferase [Gammaproteobacteria bacterium]|nr:MAG: type 1 glutamine amidotransferase [Gammaproteobacteria bacterium]
MFFSSFKYQKPEKKKRLHFIQHVEFESIGMIEQWALEKEFQITSTKMYLNEELPDRKEMREIDLLLVMGGPMNIYEYDEYPWLKEEKIFLKKAIREATLFKNMTVLGFCLGAQLLSEALGGSVTENQYKEIGWFPIRSTDDMLEDNLNVFHWHSDTFSIPKGAKCIAFSQGCANQGFVYKQQVIGLQFHLEMTAENIETIYTKCASELETGPYVQLQNISDSSRISNANTAMTQILERMVG